MNDKIIFLAHLHKLYTTVLGNQRIIRNLHLAEDDAISVLKNIILTNEFDIYKSGKNWYVEVKNIRITIHQRSYSVITAHLVNQNK